MKLFKGNCIVVGRKSPVSLYVHNLATYDKGDVFDQSASLGFIHIWGLPVKIQSMVQGDGSKTIFEKVKEVRLLWYTPEECFDIEVLSSYGYYQG